MIDIEGFLSELADLTRKYGVEIVGCGCCGSPSLWPLEHPDGKYTADKYPRASRYVDLTWVTGEEDA